MNTFYNKYDYIEKLIFEQGLRIESIDIDINREAMSIHLNNGSAFIAPLELYKRFANATFKALNNFRLISNGTGVHWPELDEDLSLKGFIEDYLNAKLKGNDKELVIA